MLHTVIFVLVIWLVVSTRKQRFRRNYIVFSVLTIAYVALNGVYTSAEGSQLSNNALRRCIELGCLALILSPIFLFRSGVLDGANRD